MEELTKEELLDIETNLKEGSLIDKDDSLEVTFKGDYWEKFLIFNNQIRGYYYFTKKKIVFIGGALGSTTWAVPYESIKELKKCKIALFMPTGIKIEFYDETKNRLKKYKMSILKRDKWFEYINAKLKK
jgi:hypothetical protein